MSDMEDYLGRCEGLAIHWSERVPSEDLRVVFELIGHGEPAEGMCSLAWILDRSQIEPTAAEVAAIRALTSGLVSVDDLPQSFR